MTKKGEQLVFDEERGSSEKKVEEKKETTN